MGPRHKRQKLDANGAEVSVSNHADTALSHTKTTDKDKQSTLYIRSLPTTTTNASLAEHFSQSFPVKHAVVVTDKETGNCKGYGFVTFVDHEDAKRALEEFHGKDFEGKKLNVTLAERRFREEGNEAPSGTHAAKVKEPPQSSKLIVRNLPWSIDSTDKLTKLFLSFGKINQAIVPKDPKGRMKGFGIVMLRGRKNAELALERLNGKEIDGRTLAVDWAADRDTWQQAQATSREAEREAKEAAKAEVKEAERVDSGQDENEEHEDEDEVEEGSDVDNDEELSELEDAEDEEMHDPEEEDDDEANAKQHQTSNEAVLFIRNLPFTTTDEDLYEHFGALYPVRYARIAIDRATERPKGTGFVCFYKKEDADACLREAPRAAKVQEDHKNDKKRGGKKEALGQSILENEFTDPTGRYTLDGRVLQLTRAVDKSEAERLTTEGVATRNRRDRDKRRLYLLSEGTIPSNSPLYQKLSPSEQAMREASAKQRKKLIESNPSLNISLVRLSVRNIPRHVTTSDLKNLARQAVVGFATDVKEGKRERVSKEELARDTEETLEADKQRRLKKKGIVKQAKIIFEGSEGSKVEEASGGRSRGYGFVEYYTHRSALMGLRWLNGHSIEYQTKDNEKKGRKGVSQEEQKDRKRRLIVEFAIENAQVVKRRQDREIKAREKPRDGKAKAVNGEDPETEAGKSFKGKNGKGGERKGNRWGDDKRNGTPKRKGDGKSGAFEAAKRVARKEARLGKAGANGANTDGKERSKDDVKRVIARKRRDRKEQRRASKGKA